MTVEHLSVDRLRRFTLCSEPIPDEAVTLTRQTSVVMCCTPCYEQLGKLQPNYFLHVAIEQAEA